MEGSKDKRGKEELTPNNDTKEIEEDSEENPIGLREEIFDCPLCQNLLYEPVTTSCGHTYCKHCLLRAMERDNRCPLCRNVIHVTPEYGVSFLLAEVIKQNFPQRYDMRKSEIEMEIMETKFNLPLFFLGSLILYPKMTLPLHVFEPRYKLMIRRCLEGSRRFGIVPMINNKLCQIGTTAVIENHYVFPDGRNLIATCGSSRFRVERTWEQDGYMCAKVEYMEEEVLTSDSEALKQVQETFEKAKNMINSKLTQDNEALPQIEEKFGRMPTSDPVFFSWWVSAILPVPPQKKYELLEIKGTLERLNQLILLLEDVSIENPSSCLVS